jgi:hypothetical protein
MTERAALLDHADRLLDGSVALGARATRVAALLARSAFEDWLDSQSPWAATMPKPASAKAKLAVLGVLDDTDLGERAKRVWYGLSRVCHHHSYELQPSPHEVRQLVADVRQLDG